MAIGSASHNGIIPDFEEPKAIMVEKGNVVDVQEKEISMEGLCSISAYDQWTPLPVSGQLPRPRYKVLFGFVGFLVSLLRVSGPVARC
jgi:hypothetical protein